MLNVFEKELPRIENKDIYTYSLDQLSSLVEELKSTKSKSQMEKLDPTEVDRVFENDKILVISPKSFKASQKYGRSTRWCITQEKHWESYTNEKLIKFYFVIDKTKTPYIVKDVDRPEEDEGDPLQKVAIGVNKNGEIIGAWDSHDTKIAGKDDYTIDLFEYLKSIGFDESLLKPMEMTEEVVMRLITKGALSKNDDGSYDITGSVKIQAICVKDGQMTLKFNKIKGNFYCQGAQLTTLKNCPKIVTGQFNCSDNNISSLEDGPLEVGQFYNCSYNALTSLKGAPNVIDGDFVCVANHLTTLEGAPESVFGEFMCNKNKLTDLNGSPKEVEGSFLCNQNDKLVSLEGMTKELNEFSVLDCSHTSLTNLKGCSPSIRRIIANETTLKSLDGCSKILNYLECTNGQLETLEGGPSKITENFIVYGNMLTSLKGAPESVGKTFDCSGNRLTSLEGAPKTVERFICGKNSVQFSNRDVESVSDVRQSIMVY